jgi:hypothetical protein
MLSFQKPESPSKHDFLDELKNVCIKILLLWAIKNIPIYAKTIKDLCLKKAGRKKKEQKIVQVKGQLANLMSTSITMEKYIDPGVPLVIISINNFSIPNTLIDLGATINVMTMETLRNLKIYNIRPTPTILEFADRSKVNPKV